MWHHKDHSLIFMTTPKMQSIQEYGCQPIFTFNPIRCGGLETLSGAGWQTAPTVRSTCGTFWPKNSSQPHISPRLRCFNRKITQKLCATCITRHLFWLVISPSCCSRQGPPLWNWGNFDHFNPLQTTLNVIWLKKVVPNLPFTYLGKVKKNWQLFPLLFFGESQKYERGGVCRPPPHPIGLTIGWKISDQLNWL